MIARTRPGAERRRGGGAHTGGQALVEFAVALIAVMVLLAGLIQIGQLSRARTATLIAARRNAAVLALGASAPPAGAVPVISSWMPGPDGRRYTHDDFAVGASNAMALPRLLAGMARLGSVPQAPPNAISRMAASGAAEFGLVRGDAADTVPTLPVIRNLVYPRPEIELESEVWLTWTEGLY